MSCIALCYPACSSRLARHSSCNSRVRCTRNKTTYVTSHTHTHTQNISQPPRRSVRTYSERAHMETVETRQGCWIVSCPDTPDAVNTRRCKVALVTCHSCVEQRYWMRRKVFRKRYHSTSNLDAADADTADFFWREDVRFGGSGWYRIMFEYVGQKALNLWLTMQIPIWNKIANNAKTIRDSEIYCWHL